MEFGLFVQTGVSIHWKPVSVPYKALAELVSSMMVHMLYGGFQTVV